jgi:hypothetical protein
MNYRLHPGFVGTLIKAADKLAQRRKDNMSSDFPLTKEQVQLALIDPKMRDPYAQIRAAGGRLVLSTMVTVDIGELEWKLIINNPGPGFDVLDDKHIHHSSPYREVGPFYREGLTIDEISALLSWVRTAVLEAKICDLTKKVVTEFLEHGHDVNPEKFLSVGHIMARWPTLKILVDETKDKTWIRRFNEHPVNLKRYRWTGNHADEAWRNQWGKSMKVADMVLTSASLMFDVQRKPTDLVAAVVGVK